MKLRPHSNETQIIFILMHLDYEYYYLLKDNYINYIIYETSTSTLALYIYCSNE